MTEIVRELQLDTAEEQEEEEEEAQDGWEEPEAEWSEESNGYDEPNLSEGLIGLPGNIDPHALEDMVADSSLAIYFRDITRVPLLTAEQEVELATAYEKGENAKLAVAERVVGEPRLEARLPELGGDERERRQFLEQFSSLGAQCRSLAADVESGEAARRRLMESNLRLVVSVARKYMGRGLPLLDLIQEGNIGLSRAVEKFDYRRGFKFSTYAYWWIRQAVTRAIANQSRTIRVPVHMIEFIGDVFSASQRLQQDLGREPLPEEIAEAMGISVEKVRETLRAASTPISLEAPIGGDDESTVADLVADRQGRPPAEVAEERLLSDHVEEALQTLSARERLVLKMRFGIMDRRPHTLGEIAGILGLSRERVRQIEAEAIAKLRRPELRRRLKEYLE
jgi:RNA polymerase primary sigma factor